MQFWACDNSDLISHKFELISQFWLDITMWSLSQSWLCSFIVFEFICNYFEFISQFAVISCSFEFMSHNCEKRAVIILFIYFCYSMAEMLPHFSNECDVIAAINSMLEKHSQPVTSHASAVTPIISYWRCIKVSRLRVYCRRFPFFISPRINSLKLVNLHNTKLKNCIPKSPILS